MKDLQKMTMGKMRTAQMRIRTVILKLKMSFEIGSGIHTLRTPWWGPHVSGPPTFTDLDFMQGEFTRLYNVLVEWLKTQPTEVTGRPEFAPTDRYGMLLKPFSRYGPFCCAFWVSNSDRRSLCVRFMKHESTRQTTWHGNPEHPKRSVGGGTLTGVFRMLMYCGFDETDTVTKCPDALRVELLNCIKAHKRSLPDKIRTGEHPSGVWAVDVVLGLQFGFRDYGLGSGTTFY